MKAQMQKGFTLIEVLVAMVLLVILSGALYGTFFSLTRGRDAATAGMEARREVRSTLDMLRREISSRFGDGLSVYPRALCCSFHTTAGYLDQGVAARLNQNPDGVMPYIDVFRTMFPEGAGYEHDKIERRTELTAAQRPVEPLNADSHLAFMAGALRTCVSYPNRPGEPMSFIDLDGVHAGRPRTRRTSGRWSWRSTGTFQMSQICMQLLYTGFFKRP